jgi:gliding motility-associated lipoprotein GldH
MIKGANKISSVLIPAFLFLLLSCNSKVLYMDSKVMKENIWKLIDTFSFKVEVKDTITANNIIFTLRTGSSYPFRNIYLFVKTTSPSGKSRTDTLQYYIADEKGKWLGKGFGDIHELNLTYKSNIYFPEKGIYQFNIQHGMRIKDLKGVYDFGLRIEKTGK